MHKQFLVFHNKLNMLCSNLKKIQSVFEFLFFVQISKLEFGSDFDSKLDPKQMEADNGGMSALYSDIKL